MTKDLLYYPNPKLRTKSRPLETEGMPPGELARIQALVINMFDTMRANRGIGLAAIQIGIPERVVVVEAVEGQPPMAMVNPTIIELSGLTEAKKEGCLSFPGIFEEVRRSLEVHLQYWAPSQGRIVDTQVKGLRAHIVQHEVEHLDGILLDKTMPRARRGQVMGELRKFLQQRRRGGA